MSGFPQYSGHVIRWTLRIVGEPCQKHLPVVRENRDKQALPIGGAIVPGVVQTGIDLEIQHGLIELLVLILSEREESILRQVD